MRVFVTVVDCGSQAAAALRLDLSRPVVSRYLAELEEWTGARLLHRTTRKLSLTAAGKETLPRCRQVLALSDELRTAVSAPEEAPQGLLRITVSTSFGQAQLAQAVTEFVRLHPAVAVDMVLLDRAVNLVEERIDLAIRITNDLDPNVIARRLTVCRSVVCAAPDYLRGKPALRRIEDLALHNCLTHSYYGRSVWQFERDGEPVAVAVGGNVSANEAVSLMQAARAGAGVAMLPTYLAAPLIRSGELLNVLPGAKPRDMSIYAVYASRRHMPLALRTLLDFLAQRFPPQPQWDDWPTAAPG
ncbi:LysR family transcriptional regulator [Paludibacterium yongneupense]|uniref:LysR family transcriptional regulator n=1 Tax=Paludibacterium yongneupense TaxID=400061 RepID=UPI000490E0D1|nr:LysR family transcriptional regulator [Paludibacterium yongneupense]